jgi:hypothetical protein
LTTATQSYVADPLEQFIGAFSSHGTDWTDHHDAYLGQVVRDTEAKGALITQKHAGNHRN